MQYNGSAADVSKYTGLHKTAEVLLYLAAVAILFLTPWFDAYTMSYYRGSLTLIYKYELLRLVWMPVTVLLSFVITAKGVFEKDANAFKYRIVKTAFLSFSLIMTVAVQFTLFKTRILDNSAWGFCLFTAILVILLVLTLTGRVNLTYWKEISLRFQTVFCYLFSIPGAVVTLFINNDDDMLLKHAVQSILYSTLILIARFTWPEAVSILLAGLAFICGWVFFKPRLVLIDMKGLRWFFRWVRPDYINTVNLVGGIFCLIGTFFILDTLFTFTRFEAVSDTEAVDPFRYTLTRNIVFFVLNAGVGLFLIWDNSRQSGEGGEGT